MSFDPLRLREDFPDLIPEPEARSQGATAYRLRLPVLPRGREFAWAELLLPKGFPEHASAKIKLSPDAVLRIPHIEESGGLCIDGDPGPGQGYSTEERLLLLLLAYQEQFLEPWLTGKLDDDFSKEPLNYWWIEVGRACSPRDPVRAVWTVDECSARPIVKEGLLLLPGRIVIAAGEDLPITGRVIRSLGVKATQRIRVLMADIPISHTFTPSTWPRSAFDLDRLLTGRLRPAQRERFQAFIRKRRRERGVHRIVLLRNPICGFAYLLPGGPPTVVNNGARKRAYPSLSTPLPLNVTRLDPSWTVGRDQHPEVAQRQARHVLVLGAGALGAPVVDHLAKAGVGFVTLVDADYLTTANLGRHLLGAESIEQPKATAVAQRINLGYPATVVTPQVMSAERWLQKNSLSNVDLVLDLTGEPDVRWHVDQARRKHPCPLLIGWMEPYVAAAHVCSLPTGTPWMQGTMDPMGSLEAVTWPDKVIRQEPGCSSRFQSYTAAAAGYAVTLVAENALKMIDGDINQVPKIISWVRGQRVLDEHLPGLKLREWAQPAVPHDGLVMERPFP
jgi:molybdopterin/thiamine biosynthesis adenylyltransferase